MRHTPRRLEIDPVRLRNSAKGNESESCTSVVQTPLAEVFWEGMFHSAPARKGIFQHVAGKQPKDRVRFVKHPSGRNRQNVIPAEHLFALLNRNAHNRRRENERLKDMGIEI